VRITVLGKSPSWQDVDGACSGYLVEEDGCRMLVDCGNGVFSKLRRFRESEGLTFPLLSDTEREVLAAYGAYGEKKNYGKVVQGVIRSTVVIAPDGTVERGFYNVKATGHVERLKKELGV
jgi:hypothetical protein